MTAVYVAFDLETTGLDANTDSIIEIGAVRFSMEGVIDTFQTLVNPYRPVPDAVQNVTGIREADLASAPPLEAVAADFERFLGDSILVGQNADHFDLPVLDANGIRHPLELYDTQRLATILLPAHRQYGLSDLAEHFAIDFPVQHRALADAEATRLLFLKLVDRALELPADVVGQIATWLTPTEFPWRKFFRDIWEIAETRPPVRQPTLKPVGTDTFRSLKPRPDPVAVVADEPLAVLAMGKRRPDILPGFEERGEQNRMLVAVAEAFNRGERLMVEAGTGTGKSLAYLIPAACHATANDSRVVVSTSTINLQEQIAHKDVPAVQALVGDGQLKACQLKGRRNYLCLRRFNAMRGTVLTDEEAYVAARVLVWLGVTDTGDRAELRLSREEEAIWWRISADGAECSNDNSPFVVDGSCFLQRARKQAEGSHIVVVNHALMLADVAAGGYVVPPYEHLVIDEAHHLEDEATRQFGFACRQKELFELIERCDAIVPSLLSAIRNSPILDQVRQGMAAKAAAVREAARSAKPVVGSLCEVLATFLIQQSPPGDEPKLHITRSQRAQPDWSDVEIAWDGARTALGTLAAALQKLYEDLSEAERLGMLNHELILAETGNCLNEVLMRSAGISAGLEADDPQRIVWLEMDRSDGGVMLSWVPLDVADLLRNGLYADRKTVILTGATLRTQGGFRYLQERLGLDDCETLALGSPFDFRRAALVLVPRDMPEPNAPVYLDALGTAIVDLCRASGGRALVLFTSHSQLRAAHWLAQSSLREEGITGLAQGVDGSPRQLVRALKSDPRTVIFGTSSFWEGIDIPGDHLSLIIMARLPFAVPTDPVHAARSALYEDSFNAYSLPQAVIRFKQGFGRLIRTRTDRGVLVVLDQRIVAKQYGQAFLETLPGCPVRTLAMREMPDTIEAFLASKAPVDVPHQT